MTADSVLLVARAGSGKDPSGRDSPHRRPRRLAYLLVAGVVAAGSVVVATTRGGHDGTPAGPSAAAPLPAFDSTYRNDFTDLRDLRVFGTGPRANDRALPADAGNERLQKPVSAQDVQAVQDPQAEDGHAVELSTRMGTYVTSAGLQTGWTNGRAMLTGHDAAPPVRVQARVRMTPSAGTKSAVMWWPAGGGWPWEVDFAESFGGESLTDPWGSRSQVAQRWHADLNGDGKAVEALETDLPLDATQYHVYDLLITPTRMSVKIDGVERYATSDPRYLPSGPGYFSLGKALTGVRDDPARTPDQLFVDWVQIDSQRGNQPPASQQSGSRRPGGQQSGGQQSGGQQDGSQLDVSQQDDTQPGG